MIGAIALGIGSGVAIGTGVDYISDPSNFDLVSSIGNQFTDPWTYVGAIPGAAFAKFSKLVKVGRLFGKASKFSDDAEAGVTIIGKLKDTAKYLDEPGYNVLENALARRGESFWWGSNKAWLDRAIARGGEIRLVSPLTVRNVVAPSLRDFLRWGPLSVYGREISYLTLRGELWRVTRGW
ncbi:MAG TPA: hypothetical protein VGE04_07025 [Chloroflexia bacterium]